MRARKEMIVSSVQPYFAPYPGFFVKASLCDVLVILDTVQFPQRTTWMTRNRFKNEQGALWMTIPVRRKGRGCQMIGDVLLCREGSWPRKHLKSIVSSYGKAPFFEEHLPFIRSLFEVPAERLLDFNMRIIYYLLGVFGISTRVCMLSELEVRAREPSLTVEICRKLEATEFRAQSPARKFLDLEALYGESVQVRLFTIDPPVYPQLYGEFIANLSVFDLLFCCGPKAVEIMRHSHRI